MASKIKRINPIILTAIACFGLAIASGLQSQHSVDIIHQTESPYQTIYISESRRIRGMHVGSLVDRTSAMDLDAPYRHVYEYTAMMMLALGYVENPQRFLVVGLGGGTITRTLRLLYPNAEIVNVEFDSEIVSMARRYFDFVEDPRMELVVQDARRWLQHTDKQFDVIFLDAYHGGYIPFHLMTREFLELVRKRLTPAGVVCANTWIEQRLADRESATYHAVFQNFHHYIDIDSTNRIIVAAPRPLPSPAEVRIHFGTLDDTLDAQHLDFISLYDRHYKATPVWPNKTAILTDDHAPVNLLKDSK